MKYWKLFTGVVIGVIGFLLYKKYADKNNNAQALPVDVVKNDIKAVDVKIEEVLDKVGMKGFASKMPHQLSGGEQQRVGIARALLNDPELILADEPTGNLDPQTSIEVMEVLRKINANGKTILMATHDYALVLKYPSKTLKFEEGKMFEVIQRTV